MGGTSLRSLAGLAFLGALTQAADSGGVLLWAHGKSATDFYAKSVIMTANWTFCNGNKESFRVDVAKLSHENLKGCLDRGERFAHIKPMDLKYSDVGHTPTELFEAVAKAGWSTVVVLFRENSLSHHLSALNWAARHEDDNGRDMHIRRAMCLTDDVVEHRYKPDRRVIIDGIQAALANNLKLILLSYGDVTKDACGAVADTLRLHSPTHPGADRSNCVLDEHNMHSVSHVEKPLSENLGRVALGCTMRFFAKHPNWAWMLDDNGRRHVYPDFWRSIDYNVTHPLFYRREIGGSLLQSTLDTSQHVTPDFNPNRNKEGHFDYLLKYVSNAQGTADNDNTTAKPAAAE